MSASSDIILEEGTRSGLACKRLIQYVYERGLEQGELLPPQEELRGRLKFSHTSLSRAMQSMTNHGLIERRRRSGTRVVDREAIIPGLWTVAIPIFSIDEQNDLFINTLVRFVEAELSKAGCRWRTYLRRREADHGPSSLKDFRNLQADLKSHRVDAVLSSVLLDDREIQGLESRKIPICSVHSLETGYCAVGIESSKMVTDAVARLCLAGCRHLALVGHSALFSQRLELVRGAFVAATKTFVSTGGRAESIAGPDNATRQTGQRLGQFLLDRSPAQRPDGIVILSDTVAVGLSEVVAAVEGYRPKLAVQTNRQIPLAFALPATCYEVDVAEMARIGVEMIIRRMRNPLALEHRQCVVPQRKEAYAPGDAKDESFIANVQVVECPVSVS